MIRSMQVFFAGAFGVFACGSIASWVRTYFFGVAAHRVAQRLRSTLFAALMQQDVAFFDEQRSGELVTILMEVRLNSFAQLFCCFKQAERSRLLCLMLRYRY
jgi:ABC-type multidrug transport system fused ATPase/permease subunit